MKSIHHIPAPKPLRLLARTIAGLALLTALPGYAQSVYEPYTFTTIAGKAKAAGSADGMNSASRFNQPQTLALDANGNLYVADRLNHAIRKMTPVGPDWLVTTIAGKPGSSGSADGTNSDAQFNGPNGLAMDANGNLYVSELYNNTLRKMTPVGTNWVVTTLAGKAGSPGGRDGTNNVARSNWPASVALDTNGNLFVADFFNHRFDGSGQLAAPLDKHAVGSLEFL